jgi:hypothetical protein
MTRSDRFVTVWTTAEIAKVVSHHPDIIAIKKVFPGATVRAIRSKARDDEAVFDDPIPF